MKNIVCLKWGSLYGPEYVNNLYAMVKRNMSSSFRFVCFTDDPTGLHKEVEHMPIPEHLKGWWGKIYFFKAPLADLNGPTLAIDLDMVIISSLEPYFAYKPGVLCMKHDYPKHAGMSSCIMRLEANTLGHVYANLDFSKMDYAQNNHVPGFKKHKYWGDQIWIADQMKGLPVGIWPKQWNAKFILDCHKDPNTNKLFSNGNAYYNCAAPVFDIPDEAKVLVFSGVKQRNEKEMDKIGKWWHSKDLIA